MRDNFKYLYDMFPSMYHIEDKKNKYQLKRYLQSMYDGGILPLKDEIHKIEDLRDVEKCPDFAIPLHCLENGIPFYNDIGLKYQRRILKNIKGLWKMKGSVAPLKYVVRALTGFDSEIIVETDPEKKLFVEVISHTGDVDIDNTLEVVDRYVRLFTPIFFNWDSMISIRTGIQITIQKDSYEFPNDLRVTDQFSTEDELAGLNVSHKIQNVSQFYEFSANLGITDEMTTEYITMSNSQTDVSLDADYVGNKVEFIRAGTVVLDKKGRI